MKNISNISKNHPYRTIVPDHSTKKLFFIYSKRPINNGETVDAIKDVARQVSKSCCFLPEYGNIYETVNIHFCVAQKLAAKAQ